MSGACLVTISVSHYCEKARWALERAGVPFEEVRHPPVLHIAHAWRAGGRRTVPVLIDEAGRFNDSSAILAHLDEGLPEERRLYPSDPELRAEVERWEERCDEVLGPHVRRFAYGHLLDHPSTPGLLSEGVKSRSERVIYRLAKPLVHAMMRKAMRINAPGVARSEAKVQEVFGEVAEQVAGRRYLVGERFSAADLSFAALAAPLVVPERYGTRLPSLAELPAELRQRVEAFRAHPAGVFALRLYAEER